MVENKKFNNPNFIGQSNADPGNVLKSAHNPAKKSLDISDVDTLVPEKWDRVSVTYDVDNNPTKSEYYRDIFNEISQIITVSDVNSSLNNKYLTLYSGRDQTKYHVWYNVGGAGTDPAPVGSTGIEIPIQINEPKEVIALVTKQKIELVEDFTATSNENVITITTLEKGITTNIVDNDTNFNVSTLQNGNEELIRTVNLTFNGSNPVYRGQEYVDYKYDIFSGKLIYDSLSKYQTTDGGGDPAVNISGNITVTPQNKNTAILQNISAPLAGTEYVITIPANVTKYEIRARDTGACRIQYSYVSGQTNSIFKTIYPGSSKVEENVTFTSPFIIYFETSKSNQTIEVEVWQ